MVVTRMRGRFRSFSGTFHIAEVPENCSSKSPSRPQHRHDQRHGGRALRGEGFLDAEKFSEMHYRSNAARHVEANRWLVDGELTIRGVTRPIRSTAPSKGPWPWRAVGAPAWALSPGENLTGATTRWLPTRSLQVRTRRRELVRIELDTEAILP